MIDRRRGLHQVAVGQPAHRRRVYNFTTVPGEGYGDNGQGTEIDLLLAAKPSKHIEVDGPHPAAFNQNHWTNFGGFGGRNPPRESSGRPCVGGDCGEFDPRSNEYIKMRGLTARFTPGFQWLDSATIGSTDLGMFDPFTIGKIRYIDRDNAKAVLFQGSLFDRQAQLRPDRASRCRASGPARTSTPAPTPRAGRRLRPAAQVSPSAAVRRRAASSSASATSRSTPTGHATSTTAATSTRRFSNDVYGVQASASIRLERQSTSAATTTTRRPSRTRRSACPPASALSGFSPVLAGKHRRPGLQGRRRPQRSVRHRPVVQPRVLQHRRPVHARSWRPAASPTCC